MCTCENILGMFGLAFSFLLLAKIFLKTKHPILSTILHMGFGVLALFCLHVVDFAIPVKFPISLLSVGISGVLGIPGVAFLAIASIL